MYITISINVGGDSESDNPSQRILAVLGDPDNNLQVEVEVLGDDTALLQQYILPSDPSTDDISRVSIRNIYMRFPLINVTSRTGFPFYLIYMEASFHSIGMQ